MSIKPRLPNYRRRGKKLDGDSVADVAGDTTDMMEDNADEVGDTVADNDSIVAVLDDSVVEDTVSEDSMTLDDVSQRGPEVQTETVQEDEELEDVDALDDIFADDKDIDCDDFCEGYLNEIDSWSGYLN